MSPDREGPVAPARDEGLPEDIASGVVGPETTRRNESSQARSSPDELLELAHDGRAPPVDLLTQAIERARPLVADRSRSTKERIRLLWAAAKMARELGASDVVNRAFMALALKVQLIDSNGRWTGEDVRESVRRYGAEDVAHAIRWALRGWNPFEEGPFE